ncbi:hypothetical protein KKA01_00620 [Patescibacteria group bacterium]|nr:hypothetical protein [Patescibacteria group bacterium]
MGILDFLSNLAPEEDKEDKIDEQTYYLHGAQRLARSICNFAFQVSSRTLDLFREETKDLKVTNYGTVVSENIIFFYSVIRQEHLEARFGSQYGPFIVKQIENELVALLFGEDLKTGDYFLDNNLIEYRKHVPIKNESEFRKVLQDKLSKYSKDQLNDDQEGTNTLRYNFVHFLTRIITGDKTDKKYSFIKMKLHYLFNDMVARLILRERDLLEKYYE